MASTFRKVEKTSKVNEGGRGMNLLSFGEGLLVGTLVFWTPIVVMDFFKKPDVNMWTLIICLLEVLASVIGMAIMVYSAWKLWH